MTKPVQNLSAIQQLCQQQIKQFSAYIDLIEGLETFRADNILRDNCGTLEKLMLEISRQEADLSQIEEPAIEEKFQKILELIAESKAVLQSCNERLSTLIKGHLHKTCELPSAQPESHTPNKREEAEQALKIYSEAVAAHSEHPLLDTVSSVPSSDSRIPESPIEFDKLLQQLGHGVEAMTLAIKETNDQQPHRPHLLRLSLKQMRSLKKEIEKFSKNWEQAESDYHGLL